MSPKPSIYKIVYRFLQVHVKGSQILKEYIKVPWDWEPVHLVDVLAFDNIAGAIESPVQAVIIFWLMLRGKIIFTILSLQGSSF